MDLPAEWITHIVKMKPIIYINLRRTCIRLCAILKTMEQTDVPLENTEIGTNYVILPWYVNKLNNKNKLIPAVRGMFIRGNMFNFEHVINDCNYLWNGGQYREIYIQCGRVEQINNYLDHKIIYTRNKIINIVERSPEYEPTDIIIDLTNNRITYEFCLRDNNKEIPVYVNWDATKNVIINTFSLIGYKIPSQFRIAIETPSIRRKWLKNTKFEDLF